MSLSLSLSLHIYRVPWAHEVPARDRVEQVEKKIVVLHKQNVVL